jgi:thiosulfate/3-mercaptopyruvate sulfurtransferase
VVGALDKERVITYCGGGIAASSDALVLTLLGAKNVALYDGSMTEWGADPSLPLETGDAVLGSRSARVDRAAK